MLIAYSKSTSSCVKTIRCGNLNSSLPSACPLQGITDFGRCGIKVLQEARSRLSSESNSESAGTDYSVLHYYRRFIP